MKTMMTFFANELLPYFNIEEKAAGIMTVETVKLEIQKAYEDFNLLMENGECYHFEFQSENKGRKNLRRSRFYEAGVSYDHNVPVTTFVLFSGGVLDPMSEMDEGINTYHIHPIIMRERNADELLQNLRAGLEAGDVLSLEDLVPLALTPLMGGKMPLPERIREAFSILTSAQGSGAADRDLVDKLTAVLYAMSEKFLSGSELDYAREGVQMTRLGQMLVDEGIEQGRAQVMHVMQAMIQDDMRVGTAKERILQKLQTYFDLPAEEAERYYIQYSQKI